MSTITADRRQKIAGRLGLQDLLVIPDTSTVTGKSSLPQAIAASGQPPIRPSMNDYQAEVITWEARAETIANPRRELAKWVLETLPDEIYSLAAIGDIPGATDRVFDQLDRLLCDGQFDLCDDVIRRLEPRKLPSSLRRSFLTITAAAKNKLPARATFYQTSLKLLSEEKGEEQARKLLSRLE